MQKIGGVNDDNMGRQTNAQSGEAIKARQSEGALQTSASSTTSAWP
jgi:hypothetical protein